LKLNASSEVRASLSEVLTHCAPQANKTESKTEGRAAPKNRPSP
jgi:hypothetical protein